MAINYLKGPPLVIGIGGGSGAGKTTLLQFLQQRLDHSCILDLDSYYLDRSGLSPEICQALNYDEPKAFDINLLLEHLDQLKMGCQIAKPVYSFNSHTRNGSTVVMSAPIVVVEGILTLWWAELRMLLDVKVFVDAPPDIRLLRRIKRDLSERGRDLHLLLTQYLESVRPMHECYVEPTRVYADIVIENDGAAEPATQALLAVIGGKLKSKPIGLLASGR